MRYDRPSLSLWGLLGLALTILPVTSLLVACQSTAQPQTLTSASSAITTQAVPTTSAWDGFCAVAIPMTYSAKDSAATVMQIHQANCLGEVHCGWPRDPFCKVPTAK